ncbi:MAG: 4'-phosphopantetheinyl transferase superfamily protein [Arenicella sp.]|nr:4'-phosphopantetheinyl transferase superfamily protein [Arenicella sp.]
MQLEWRTHSIFKPPPLGEDEVHLWCAPLALDHSLVAVAMSLLNDVQRDKYHRRATTDLQQAYLAGRYYLMHLLAGYAGVAPDQVLLSYSALNKPYLNPNQHDLQFNFTDTVCQGRSWGLFAFSRKHEIGVDIECLSRRSDFKAIVKRRFSPAEANFVRHNDESVNDARFLAYWTRKEAFGKAIGRGISFTMRDVDLASPGEFKLQFITNGDPSLPFQLLQIQIEQELISALVVSGHQPLSIRAFNCSNQIP